jgi:hypothetical protein
MISSNSVPGNGCSRDTSVSAALIRERACAISVAEMSMP